MSPETIINGLTVAMLVWVVKGLVQVTATLAVHSEKHRSSESRLDKLEATTACHK